MGGRFWIINGEAVFVREDGRVYDGFKTTRGKQRISAIQTEETLQNRTLDRSHPDEREGG